MNRRIGVNGVTQSNAFANILQQNVQPQANPQIQQQVVNLQNIIPNLVVVNLQQAPQPVQNNIQANPVSVNTRLQTGAGQRLNYRGM